MCQAAVFKTLGNFTMVQSEEKHSLLEQVYKSKSRGMVCFCQLLPERSDFHLRDDRINFFVSAQCFSSSVLLSITTLLLSSQYRLILSDSLHNVCFYIVFDS